MKRLIALLLAVVFCVTLFPTATAFAHDPRFDLVSPDELTDPDEDTPWVDQKSPTDQSTYPVWLLGSGSTLYLTAYVVIGVIVAPVVDVSGDDIGNNETKNTGTTLEVGGTSSR